MKRFFILSALLLTIVTGAFAQRKTDALDRGLIAIKTANGVYCSWRILGEEYYDVKYNLYRDGTKVNSEPLNVSNYSDAAGTAASKYTVKAVVRGVEEANASKVATVWENKYLEINPTHADLKSVYVPNDACCADVTGDGQLEILMKFDNQSEISQSYPKNGPKIDGVDTHEYSLFECLKLDGTRLWWINCGPNMGDFQNNEQNIAAYDWDGDGKAEAIMRAADGTTIHASDGKTYIIGDANKNYRGATGGGANWFMHDGAEYLVYMNGETGVPYQIMEYPLKRLEDGETDLSKAWGDGYGHRSSKHFFGAPYLDGRKPSIFLARGIYTRHKMIAYDVNPATHELTVRWRWNCNDSSSPWYGNGYHNYAIADVDWDGRDEICFGSMVIDDNGKGLSTTGLGHGDAQHHGDFNPYIHGHEIYACNEDRPDNNYRDATTSKIYYRQTSSNDDGRAMMGNFSNEYPGCLGRSGHDTAISSVTNAHIPVDIPFDVNFRIYWDGDLLEETFNGTGTRNSAGRIYKPGVGNITTLTGSLTNNDTKATPCYQGDLFGDWREEVMMRTADNKIRIYTTTIPTEWRNYTLWHDMQYRNAMVWQMNGYNQPPHTSYFLGELEGITMAPPALTNTGRTEIENGGSIGTTLNDKQVMLAATDNATASVADGASPYIFFDNAPSWVQGTDVNGTSGKDAEIIYDYYTHTLTGGAFTGSMRLVKQGDGTLVLPNVTETYTGNTDVWAGTLQFDGTMQSSPVWLNRHTNLISNGGNFKGGIKADYNATIYPGGKDQVGTLTTTTLALGFGSRIVFDGNASETDKVTADKLTIEKKDWQYGPEYSAPVFEIVDNGLVPGNYTLATVSELAGNVSDIKIEGIKGKKFTLTFEEGKIVLTIIKLRDATEIVWNGGTDGVWDFAESENFTINGTNGIFVTGDAVTFNDQASTSNVNVAEEVYPGSVVFDNSKDYTLSGDGSIVGATTLTKKGEGNLTINNINKYTGGTKIESGKITVSALADLEGSDYGALGGVDDKITLDGGTLVVPAGGRTSQSIGLGKNGGTLEVKGNFTLSGSTERNGANINAFLHKTGSGTLTLSTINKYDVLYVDAGTVNIRETSASMMSAPTTIIFNGTNTTVADENNSYSYSKNTTNFEVAENATGKLYLDGRCDYSGTLKGTGSLTVYATYVRNNLNGNWSNFEGTLIANHSGNSYEFTWNNGYGLPKATLNIDGSTTFTCKGSTLTLGALDGSGTLSMTGNLTVGKADRDMNFSGTFNGSVNVFKEGTGAWTLKSAVNANEYTFREGDVVLNNTRSTTSLFGSATATVQDAASLKGVGTVGNIRVIEGGTVEPGDVTKTRHYGAINSTGFMYFYPTSKLNLNVYKVLTNNNGRSYITVKGKLEIKGDINIGMGEEYEPQAGDEFIMWTCGSIDAAPTAINLPELPAGLEWDTTDLLTTTGTLRVKAATGIENNRANSSASGKTYTLDGKAVENTTKKGIYIKNGKKVVIK